MGYTSRDELIAKYNINASLEEKLDLIKHIYNSGDPRCGDAPVFFMQCIGYEDNLKLLYSLIPVFGYKNIDLLINGVLLYLQINSRTMPVLEQKNICYAFLRDLGGYGYYNPYTKALYTLSLQYCLLHYQTEMKGAEAAEFMNLIRGSVKNDFDSQKKLALYWDNKEQSVYWAIWNKILSGWDKERKYSAVIDFLTNQYYKDGGSKQPYSSDDLWYFASTYAKEKLYYEPDDYKGRLYLLDIAYHDRFEEDDDDDYDDYYEEPSKAAKIVESFNNWERESQVLDLDFALSYGISGGNSISMNEMFAKGQISSGTMAMWEHWKEKQLRK